MLARHVSAHGVVAGEGARAVWAGHTDALMPLADVSSQIGLVTVGALTKRASKFRACKKERLREF